MRTKLLVTFSFAVITLFAGAMSATGCSDDNPVIASPQDSGTDTSTPPAPNEAGPTLGAAGAACTAGTACQGGNCVDGVCCESACNGSCERCNLPGSLGKCTAVPDGEDPDKECSPGPAPDAGIEEMLDAGPDADAGKAFVVPDGGPPAVNDNMCAGHCNGKRACAFAGSEMSCGTAFCGNGSQQGRASCDGKGHCLYGVEECSAYACPNGSPGCKASCSSPNDCLATHYCDGPTATCKKKLDNGTLCAEGSQCGSGVCDTNGGGGICCNIDCSTTPGGTCRKSGSAGVCQCNACATGSCALYYRDEDGDGFGDKDGTVVNGRAQYACEAGPAPAGYVKDSTDCFDSASPIAASVRPNQTGWFTAPYTNGSGVPTFDYDCSGTPEKEIWEGACGFCRNFVIGPPLPGAEPVPPPQSPSPEGFCLVQSFTSTCSSTTANAGRYCSCGAQNPPSFNTPVACGATGSASTCNKCAAQGGASTTTFDSSKTQRCH